MNLLTLITPTTVQDWIAVSVAAASALAIIFQKLRQVWRTRRTQKDKSLIQHP